MDNEWVTMTSASAGVHGTCRKRLRPLKAVKRGQDDVMSEVGVMEVRARALGALRRRVAADPDLPSRAAQCRAVVLLQSASLRFGEQPGWVSSSCTFLKSPAAAA